MKAKQLKHKTQTQIFQGSKSISFWVINLKMYNVIKIPYKTRIAMADFNLNKKIHSFQKFSPLLLNI